MIEAASHHLPDGPISHRRHGYSVMDATKLFDYLQCTDLTALDRHELGIADSLQPVEGRYTKILSNAALHWSVPTPSHPFPYPTSHLSPILFSNVPPGSSATPQPAKTSSSPSSSSSPPAATSSSKWAATATFPNYTPLSYPPHRIVWGLIRRDMRIRGFSLMRRGCVRC